MRVFERDSPLYARDVDNLQKILEDSRSLQNILEENSKSQKNIDDLLNSTYFCKEESHWLCLLCNKKYTAKFTVKDHIYKLRCKKLTREHIETIKEKVKFKNYIKKSMIELEDIDKITISIPTESKEIESKQLITLEPLDIVNEILPEGNKKIKIIRNSKQTNINNGIVNNTTNNTTNNNTINNNTVNNIVIVNPLGLETLTHTTPELYKKIIKGGQHNIVRFLLEAIYSQQENQNFFKDNKNQPHIAYIDDTYTIKYMHESQLRDYILRNIPSKIEQLIYIHQKSMKPEDVVKYLTNSINIEKNFINLDNKSNPNYKNLIDIGNTVNTVIRTHGVKDNILKSQDLYITNQTNVTKVIDDQKKLKTDSYNEFNDKTKATPKATAKVIEAPEKEVEVKEIKKHISADGELNEDELLELTGYDLKLKNKKKTTKVSSPEKKDEVHKSLYDLKNDLSIQYDKTFSSNINTL